MSGVLRPWKGKMKLATPIGVLILSFAVGVGSATTTFVMDPNCATLRWVGMVVGDGSVPTIWEVDYGYPPGANWDGINWYYLESGAIPGSVQTGADHVVLGAAWGHDRTCSWPVAEERDYELY
jgi:hypothetical protein